MDATYRSCGEGGGARARSRSNATSSHHYYRELSKSCPIRLGTQAPKRIQSISRRGPHLMQLAVIIRRHYLKSSRIMRCNNRLHPMVTPPLMSSDEHLPTMSPPAALGWCSLTPVPAPAIGHSRTPHIFRHYRDCPQREPGCGVHTLRQSARGESAVDEQFGSGDVTALVASQEQARWQRRVRRDGPSAATVGHLSSRVGGPVRLLLILVVRDIRGNRCRRLQG